MRWDVELLACLNAAGLRDITTGNRPKLGKRGNGFQMGQRHPEVGCLFKNDRTACRSHPAAADCSSL